MATVVVALAGYLLNTTAARRFAPGQYSQFGIMINLLGILAPLSSSIINAVLRRSSLNRASGVHEETASIQRALPLADQNVRGYAGIYATGTMTLAIILFLPLIVMFNRDQNAPPLQDTPPVMGEDSLIRTDAGSEDSWWLK